MSDPFDEIALRAAVNILRDSAEAGRMPSGEKLPADAARLHTQAADHLEAKQRSLFAASFDDAATASTERRVRVEVELTEDEAWNLAQFLKRVGFSDFRTNAQDDAEAYGMRDAADRVRGALAAAGYAPR